MARKLDPKNEFARIRKDVRNGIKSAKDRMVLELAQRGSLSGALHGNKVDLPPGFTDLHRCFVKCVTEWLEARLLNHERRKVVEDAFRHLSHGATSSASPRIRTWQAVENTCREVLVGPLRAERERAKGNKPLETKVSEELVTRLANMARLGDEEALDELAPKLDAEARSTLRKSGLDFVRRVAPLRGPQCFGAARALVGPGAESLELLVTTWDAIRDQLAYRATRVICFNSYFRLMALEQLPIQRLAELTLGGREPAREALAAKLAAKYPPILRSKYGLRLEDAQDVVQQALNKVFDKYLRNLGGSYDAKRPFETLFWSVLYRTLVDLWRKGSRHDAASYFRSLLLHAKQRNRKACSALEAYMDAVYVSVLTDRHDVPKSDARAAVSRSIVAFLEAETKIVRGHDARVQSWFWQTFLSVELAPYAAQLPGAWPVQGENAKPVVLDVEMDVAQTDIVPAARSPESVHPSVRFRLDEKLAQLWVCAHLHRTKTYHVIVYLLCRHLQEPYRPADLVDALFDVPLGGLVELFQTCFTDTAGVPRDTLSPAMTVLRERLAEEGLADRSIPEVYAEAFPGKKDPPEENNISDWVLRAGAEFAAALEFWNLAASTLPVEVVIIDALAPQFDSSSDMASTLQREMLSDLVSRIPWGKVREHSAHRRESAAVGKLRERLQGHQAQVTLRTRIDAYRADHDGFRMASDEDVIGKWIQEATDYRRTVRKAKTRR